MSVNTQLMEDLMKVTPHENQAELKQIIEDLSLIVDEIQSHPPTTKNYYGEYMPHCKDKTTAYLLILAGGNPKGIRSACKINGIL